MSDNQTISFVYVADFDDKEEVTVERLRVIREEGDDIWLVYGDNNEKWLLITKKDLCFARRRQTYGLTAKIALENLKQGLAEMVEEYENRITKFKRLSEKVDIVLAEDALKGGA